MQNGFIMQFLFPLAPFNDHRCTIERNASGTRGQFLIPECNFFYLSQLLIRHLALPCKPRHPRPRITDNGRINRALRIACRYWFPPFLQSLVQEEKLRGFPIEITIEHLCNPTSKGDEWERGEGIDWISAWSEEEEKGRERIKLIANETHNARSEVWTIVHCHHPIHPSD